MQETRDTKTYDLSFGGFQEAANELGLPHTFERYASDFLDSSVKVSQRYTRLKSFINNEVRTDNDIVDHLQTLLRLVNEAPERERPARFVLNLLNTKHDTMRRVQITEPNEVWQNDKTTPDPLREIIDEENGISVPPEVAPNLEGLDLQTTQPEFAHVPAGPLDTDLRIFRDALKGSEEIQAIRDMIKKLAALPGARQRQKIMQVVVSALGPTFVKTRNIFMFQRVFGLLADVAEFEPRNSKKYYAYDTKKREELLHKMMRKLGLGKRPRPKTVDELERVAFELGLDEALLKTMGHTDIKAGTGKIPENKEPDEGPPTVWSTGDERLETLAKARPVDKKKAFSAPDISLI